MSGFFKDSVFDNLDDISQLVEPFQSKFNDEIYKLPDQVDIDYNFLISRFKVNRWGSIDSIDLKEILSSAVNVEEINWRLIDRELENFYKLEIGTDNDKEVTLDLENETLSGPVTLVKTKNGYTDEELYDGVVRYLKDQFRSKLRRASNLHKSHINEIAEIFDIEGVNKYRGLVDKRTALLNGLVEQFEERKINIRNYELGKRFTNWLVAYIVNGNAAAIKNITLFKVMMLNGKPIYSLDNEETL